MRTDRRIPVACGIDVGTTNTKAVAIDQDGVVVARASRPTPRDAEGLLIDARDLLESISDLVTRVCGDRYVIHAVSSAGVGEDGVLVDAELAPLTPALAWFDPRRLSIFAALQPDLQAGTHDVQADPARTLVGWRWARDQAPRAAHSWLALADFAVVAWAQQTCISDTVVSRTAAWSSRDGRWDQGRVELALGDMELLPTVVAGGGVIGEIVDSTLLKRGIFAKDAVAVAGGHDHPVGAWGVHQLAPNAVLDSMGTAEVVVATRPVSSATAPQRDIDIAPAIQSAGVTRMRVEELARNVNWAAQGPAVAAHIRGLLAGSERPEAVLGSGFFLPGRRGGGRPAYAVNAPAHPRVRAAAVLGALAHAGHDAARAVAADDAHPDVRLAGGWIRSPGWIEIKAAVSGTRAAAILEPEVTAVGAAMLAARARGWQPDPGTALAGLSALSIR